LLGLPNGKKTRKENQSGPLREKVLRQKKRGGGGKALGCAVGVNNGRLGNGEEYCVQRRGPTRATPEGPSPKDLRLKKKTKGLTQGHEEK